MWWLLIVLALVAGGILLGSALRGSGAGVRWYEWVLVAVAVILAALAIQSWSGSLAELEPRAAWLFLATFGVPAVIVAALATVLIRRHGARA